MTEKKYIWDQILNSLKTTLSPSEINTWFSHTKCSKFDKNNIIIDVPNKFVAAWIKDNYQKKINSELKKITGETPRLAFRFDKKNKKPVVSYNRYLLNNNLNKLMTFSNFTVGDCNRFAYSSALEIAQTPGENYNPFYIFSKNGIGKTHLLNAVGNRIKRVNKNLNIGYIHSKNYISEFGFSSKKKKYEKFKKKYNSLDVLLFDDIQFLGNSNRIQEEFITLFDNLYSEKRQIIITADRSPGNLKKFLPNLISRLGWGLLTEIDEVDYKTKLNIVNNKIKNKSNKIPEDIINFLIKSNNDIKIILKNIIRIETYMSLNKGKINLSIVRSLIKDRYDTDIGIKEIQSVIAGYFNISVQDLISDKKKTVYSYPRHVAMYISRKLTDLSFKEIGYLFGDRDHSTIIYAINKIKKSIKENSGIKTDVNNITNLLT